jgi:hypothetical protein
MDKGKEHHIEFLETGEDASEAFEPTKQSFDLVAAAVHGAVVLPSVNAVLLRRNNRNEAEVEGQLPGVLAFVGSVHQQMNRPSRRAKPAQKLAPFRRVVGIAGGKGEGNGSSGIRCDQVNLGGPAAAGLAYRLRAVFFRAPVPSGCTLTAVLSNDTASILTRTT